jgi:hypothetical protein
MTVGLTTLDEPNGRVSAPTRPRNLDDVPGWLRPTDKMLFEWFLTRPGAPGGDLLEMGVFQGKTAIHIGSFLKPGETFTVCDLFDLARDDQTIRPGARSAYADLTQKTFEANYLAFHPQLPTIVRGRTDIITEHVAPGSCRFIHVDASHMYEHVHGDAASARMLAGPDAVVVFDDYRTEHCPGTAAAVWEAVAVGDLKIICVTANKFYGTWGDATAIQNQLQKALSQRGDYRLDIQQVLGQRLLRVIQMPNRGGPAVAKASADRVLAEAQQVLATAQSLVSQARLSRGGSNWRKARPGWRRAAAAILPPVATDTIRRLRQRTP